MSDIILSYDKNLRNAIILYVLRRRWAFKRKWRHPDGKCLHYQLSFSSSNYAPQVHFQDSSGRGDDDVHQVNNLYSKPTTMTAAHSSANIKSKETDIASVPQHIVTVPQNSIFLPTNYPCYPSVLHTAHTHGNEKRSWLLCNHKTEGVPRFLSFFQRIVVLKSTFGFLRIGSDVTWNGMACLGLACRLRFYDEALWKWMQCKLFFLSSRDFLCRTKTSPAK